ncbi:hypothetical protein D9619_012011 [Psilocybe cf. subviscida]|uniref:Uncharacterized protein n=1 Tax=Psilocybe cf. subviscida TaxID=2480587 RepID=A0A8H5B028_9AGAR|nr:hypothetical protein D9619_012011 [Psilocybe cf. subviscida]
MAGQGSSFGLLPSILIDDSNPAILYNGSWTVIADDASTDDGTSGSPILDTLHVLPVFNGSFSYDFIGTGVGVFTAMHNTRNYTAQCLVDGAQVPVTMPADLGNQPLCVAFGLPPDTPHTISVLILVEPDQIDERGPSGFCLDYILVEPSPSTSLDGYDLFIPTFEPLEGGDFDPSHFSFQIPTNGITSLSLSVSAGWIMGLNELKGYQTSVPGSNFNVSFTGTRLWWYGYGNITTAGTSPTLVYTVDGGRPTHFDWDNALFDVPVLLFNTSATRYGNHTVSVTYGGPNGTLPLSVHLLVVQGTQNATTTTNTTTTTTSSIPTTSSDNSSSKQPTPRAGSKPSHEALLGGSITVGLILLLAMISGWMFYLRRRRRRSFSTASLDIRPEPYDISVGGNTTTNGPRKARTSQHHTQAPYMQELEAPTITKWSRAAVSEEQVQEMETSGWSSPPTMDLSQLDRTASTTPHDGHFLEDTSAGTGTSTFTSATPQANDLRERDSGLRLGGSLLPPVYTTH